MRHGAKFLTSHQHHAAVLTKYVLSIPGYCFPVYTPEILMILDSSLAEELWESSRHDSTFVHLAAYRCLSAVTVIEATLTALIVHPSCGNGGFLLRIRSTGNRLVDGIRMRRLKHATGLVRDPCHAK